MVRDALRSTSVCRVLAAGLLLTCLCALGGCLERVDTSWSPDGREIAYFSENGALRYHNVATGQVRFTKPPPTPLSAPQWSPDGTAVAYLCVTTGEEPAVSLRVVDRATGKTRTLATDLWPVPRSIPADEVPEGETPAEALRGAQVAALGGLAFGPRTFAWSSDGRRLAVVAASLREMRLIAVDRADGASRSLVTETRAISVPSWSPDGRLIAYRRSAEAITRTDVWTDSEGAGTPETGTQPADHEACPDHLCIYDVERAAKREVCDLPRDEIGDAGWEWSADSSRIGFVARDHDNDERAVGYIVEARPGTQPQPALRGLTPVAAWAPDLRGVAFVEVRDDASVVLYKGLEPRTLRALGKLPKLQEDYEPSYSVPQFSPDGRKVALLVREERKPRRVVVMEVK